MGSAASLPKEDKGKFVARLRSVYERRTDETRPESLGDAGNTEHVLEGVKSEYEPRPVGSPPLKSIDEVAPPAGGVERGGFLGMGTTKAGNNNATQADGAGQLERRVEKGAGGGEQMGRSGIEDVGAENQEGNNYIGDRCKEKEEGEGGMEWMDEVDRGGRIALSFSDKPGCSNEKEGEGLLESPGVWSPVAAREDFRRRRLTFANQPNQSSNVKSEKPHTDMIFEALEVGEEATHSPPFSPSAMGLYSCHGSEPSWTDGTEACAKINQDRACVVHPFMASESCALVCVFDGHGERGDMVSNFAMNELPPRLAAHPCCFTDPEKALSEVFVEVDKALVEAAKEGEPVFSGTTAVVALFRDGKLWVANAGDSRAVIATKIATSLGQGPRAGAGEGEDREGGEGDGRDEVLEAVALSVDHNPDLDEELERICSSGGFVSPPPEPGLSARVWLDRDMTQVGLAMSRSIGDHAVKRAGVIATPEVTLRELQPEDRFIIMASDGVWEFMDNQEVVDLTQSELYFGGKNNAAHACRAIISAAAGRWRDNEGAYRDDISCVVISLAALPQGFGPGSGSRVTSEGQGEG